MGPILYLSKKKKKKKKKKKLKKHRGIPYAREIAAPRFESVIDYFTKECLVKKKKKKKKKKKTTMRGGIWSGWV